MNAEIFRIVRHDLYIIIVVFSYAKEKLEKNQN